LEQRTVMNFSNNRMPRRALVIKLRHIGDALLGTAVATALKAASPECHVTYLVTSGTEELVSLCPDVDAVVTVVRGHERAGGLGRYLADQVVLLRSLHRGAFDLALDLGGGDRAAFLAWVSGAEYRIGTLPFYATRSLRRRVFDRVVTPDVRAHTVQQDLDVLRAAGIAVQTAPIRVRVPELLRKDACARLSAAGVRTDAPLVIVHPTTRWPFKAWPEDRVADCLVRVRAEGIQVALTCGGADDEIEKFHRIVARAGAPIATFPGTLSLTQLAGLLTAAQAFLGVDSAPAHLAAALGVPTVALFGPTGAYNWGPWVPTAARTPYPAASGIQTAGPHVVIQQSWSCVPCGMAGCQGSKRSDCLEMLGVDEVVTAVLERVGRRAGAAAGAPD